MQWNANEKAWAKKNNVTLGQKKKGGLMNVAAYRNKTGGGNTGRPQSGLTMQPAKPAGGAPAGATAMGGQMAAQAAPYKNLTAQKAAGWSDAQKNWLAKNDPDKLKYGMSLTTQGVDAGGGGQSMQGGLIKGRTGGSMGALGQNSPNMNKYSTGQSMLGGAAAGTAAGAGFIAAGGLGSTAALAAMGPAGWALGAGMLAYGMMKGKKSNKQFEGTIQTGGAQKWKQERPGDMAIAKQGYVPTKEEFTQHGRWLMPEDKYAHDYGRTLGSNDAKYYDAFQTEANKYLGQMESAKTDRERNVAMGHYRNTMRAHGFDFQKAAPKPKASSPRAAAAPEPIQVPQIDQGPPKEEISPPGEGLEETVKVPHNAPLEDTDKLYAKKPPAEENNMAEEARLRARKRVKSLLNDEEED